MGTWLQEKKVARTYLDDEDERHKSQLLLKEFYRQSFQGNWTNFHENQIATFFTLTQILKNPKITHTPIKGIYWRVD